MPMRSTYNEPRVEVKGIGLSGRGLAHREHRSNGSEGRCKERGLLGIGEDSGVAVWREGAGQARRERVAEQPDVVLDVVVSRVAGRSHGVQRVRIRRYATLT